MKIKKIRVRNFNSLRGEHLIDFEAPPLSEAGLFAITGPTGSGKSTLLDAICLALYGQIPRMGAVTRTTVATTHAVLTRNTKESMAEVEYECDKGVFRSWWRIEVNRNGNLNDYEMGIDDLNASRVIDLKKSEVAEYNSKMIGLSFEQFSKSMLLAQGEFALFLKAGKNERAALLESLTGSGIYRSLGQMAYEKGKQLGDRQKQLDQIVNHERSQLLPVETYQNAKENLSFLEAQISVLEISQQQLQEKIHLMRDVVVLRESLSNLEKNERQQQFSLDQFYQEKGDNLKLHKSLLPLLGLLEQWEQQQIRLQDRELQQKQAEFQISQLKENVSQTLKRISALCGETVEQSSAIETLHSWEEGVLELENKLRELKVQLDAQEKEVVPVFRELGIDGRGHIDEVRQRLKQGIDVLDQRIQNMEQNLGSELLASPEEWVKKLENLKEALGNALVWEEKKQFYEQKMQELRDLLAENTTTLARLREDIERLTQSTALVNDKVDLIQRELDLARRMATFDEHRKSLQEGEPCPLCGALEHPYAGSHTPAPSFLEEELRLTKADQQKKQTELLRAQAELSELEPAFQRRKEEENQLREQFETMQAQIRTLSEDFGLDIQGEEIQKEKNQCEIRLNLLKEWIRSGDQIKKIREQLTRLDALEITFKAHVKAGEELKARYTGNDVRREVQGLKDALTRSIAGQENEQSRMRQIDLELLDLRSQMLSIESELIPELLSLGIDQISNALKSRLRPDEFHRLDSMEKNLLTQLEKTRLMLTDTRMRLEQTQAIEIEESPEEISQKLNAVHAELGQKRNQILEYTTQVRSHERSLAILEEKQAEMEALQLGYKKWVLLNQLIGDASGNSFSRFANELTLARLLYLSNKRLQKINPRYQLDLPTPQEPEDSLFVIDSDMGDQRRSVKTLSGGEFFMMSLALALGLSDLASQKVKIKSLFIDEGFGSLDPETLDQTIDVLEKLQAESEKTIGVISHIESIKERIVHKVEVTRLGSGFSTIRITDSMESGVNN